jgi:DNA-binding MarR family transcriptional regulator
MQQQTARSARRQAVIDRLYQSLATMMRRRTEVSAEVHPGCSLAAYTMLTQIEAVPGTRATDLAELFGLDKSTVSRQLNELEGAGLIAREDEQPGRRGHALVLTPAGGRKLEQEAERTRQHLNDRLAGWKDPEIAAFAQMVERFIEDLR